LGADLRDNARSNLDDRHSVNGTVGVEQLRHSALASEDQRHDLLNFLVGAQAFRFDPVGLHSGVP